MASLRFYLDRSSAKLAKAGQPDRAVFLRYKQGDQYFVLYPDVVVHTHEWDAGTGRVAGRSLRAQQLNTRLAQAEARLHEAGQQLRQQQQGAAPTLQQIQQAMWVFYPPRRGQNARLLQALEQEQAEQQRRELLERQAPPTLHEVFDWFMRHRALQLQDSTLETYESLRNNLRQYARTFLPEHSLALPLLNRDFFTGLRSFLLQYEYKPGFFYVNNTVNTRLKRLRTIFNELLSEGPDEMRRHVNPEYRHFKMVRSADARSLPARPTLTPREILLYYQYAFDHRSGRLARARDLYVFSYMTSLRLSDLPLVQPQHIVRRLVQLPDTTYVEQVELHLPMTQKNRKSVIIPLNQIALQILERYAGKYPQSLPVIDRDTASRYVREGLRRTGYFHDQVEVIRLHNRQRVVSVVPRYQALTFHTSRHGFATYLATKQVDMEDAQLLLGHSQLRTTQIYYHRAPQHAAQRVAQVMQELDQDYLDMTT